jgi:hypothetical protein
VVPHMCNPSTMEAEAEGSQVQGQSVLHSKTLSQKCKYICIKHWYTQFHKTTLLDIKRQKGQGMILVGHINTLVSSTSPTKKTNKESSQLAP